MRVSDRLLLYAAGTLRAIAAATTGVSIGAYLKTLGYAVGGTLALWPLAELLLITVAFFAVWNGMGRDRGPASMLEQVVLPATAT